MCFDVFKRILEPIVGNCNFGLSCKCNLCLLQPPSLRSLASLTVFHLTCNVKQFELHRDTTYDQYVYAVNSNEVPFVKLVPRFYPILCCNFIRRRNVWGKKFHKKCVTEAERVPVRWSTFDLKHCHSLQEAIGALYFNRDEWWCGFCSRPLFVSPEYIRSLQRVF